MPHMSPSLCMPCSDWRLPCTCCTRQFRSRRPHIPRLYRRISGMQGCQMTGMRILCRRMTCRRQFCRTCRSLLPFPRMRRMHRRRRSARSDLPCLGTACIWRDQDDRLHTHRPCPRISRRASDIFRNRRTCLHTGRRRLQRRELLRRPYPRPQPGRRAPRRGPVEPSVRQRG
jgi:hypothetical protein